VNQSVGRRAFMAGAAAAVAAGVAGCGTSAAPAGPAVARKRYGGDLKVGLIGGSSSDTLDPHNGLNILDTARAQAVYEPLVQLSPNGSEIEFVLASEMTPRDAQGRSWVIRLRPGIHFHDGKPLTARDVVYTFQRILGGKLSAAKVLGPVHAAGIKAVDPLTVLVPMDRPFATLPQQLAGILTAQIVPEGYTATSPHIGTGPFKFKSFTAGQQSVFTRNPHYWRPGLPYADSLTIIDFPDSMSLQDALVTGQIHGAGTLTGTQMASLGNQNGIVAVPSKAGGFVPFTMRVDQAPFNDVRVRQAMRLLVNRPQIIDSALDSYGQLASDVFAPFDPAFDPSLRRMQDIPQAKFLLKKAGHAGLRTELVTAPITPGAVSMAQVLAEQAKQAGVTIRLRKVDSDTFFANGSYLNWTFSQDFYYYAPYLSQVTLSMMPSGPWDETHFNDPEYIRLYNQANATINDKLRREIIRDMQKIDFTRGGYIIPAFSDGLDAYSTRITGYRPARVGQPLSDFGFAQFAFTADA
jgi:peptide/nickel transport system substrate-binding protein